METLWDKKWKSFSSEAVRRTSLDRLSEAIYPFLKEMIRSGNSMKVLETGCGTGRFCFALAKDFPDINMQGIDISEDSIDLCKKAKTELHIRNVSFQVMDINHMNFEEGSFDIAFNEGVIHHLSDDLTPLKEMVRIVRKGGSILLTVANKSCLPHTIYKAIKGKRYEYGHEKSYKCSELIALMEKAGLKDIEVFGVIPEYGMQRIEGYLPVIGAIITQLINLIAFLSDKVTNKRFSNKFGFQLVARGVKA